MTLTELIDSVFPPKQKQQTESPYASLPNTNEIVEYNIHSEYYGSALDLAVSSGTSAEGLHPEERSALEAVTICTLVFSNGYVITGTSAILNMDNYSWELGKKYAREDAVRKANPIMAFMLKDHVAEEIEENDEYSYMSLQEFTKLMERVNGRKATR